MTYVAVPEKTVDAWLSIYLSQRFPLLSLWSPTRGWDQAVDTGVPPDSKLVLFEVKTSQERSHQQQIPIRWSQLDRYRKHPIAKRALYYVLPEFQGNPSGSDPGTLPFPAESSLMWNVQYNVLWVASVWSLLDYFRRRSSSVVNGNLWLPASELSAGNLAMSRRLFRLAQEIENCSVGLRGPSWDGSLGGGGSRGARPGPDLPALPPDETEAFGDQIEELLEWQPEGAERPDPDVLDRGIADGGGRIDRPLAVVLPIIVS